MKRSTLTALATAVAAFGYMPERDHSYSPPGRPMVGKLAKRRAKNKMARASKKRNRQ